MVTYTSKATVFVAFFGENGNAVTVSQSLSGNIFTPLIYPISQLFSKLISIHSFENLRPNCLNKEQSIHRTPKQVIDLMALLTSLTNNRMVKKALALEAFKVGSNIGKLSIGVL